MKLIENLKSAFSNVLSHKMRSILTMIGIIIGISSVIMITALGEGAKKFVFDQVDSINSTVMEVQYRGDIEESDLLTLDDANTIEKLDNIKSVIPFDMTYGELKLRDPDKNNFGMIFGTTHNYSDAEKFELLYGRFINKVDEELNSEVAVINEKIAIDVFGSSNCIGNKLEITIWETVYNFTVIGVLKDEGQAAGIGTPLKMVSAVIPVTTLSDVMDSDYIQGIIMSINDVALSDKTSRDVYNLLSIRHDNKEKYAVSSMAAQMEEMDNVLNIVTIAVSFVAAVSLVVGGIGVMNIMLVSVTERTSEIGIRKALGATGRQIMQQFLFEAIILTVAGGAFGILTGIINAHIASYFITTLTGYQITAVTTFGIVMMAFLFSATTGIVFGLTPAKRASELNIIDALRFE